MCAARGKSKEVAHVSTTVSIELPSLACRSTVMPPSRRWHPKVFQLPHRYFRSRLQKRRLNCTNGHWPVTPDLIAVASCIDRQWRRIKSEFAAHLVECEVTSGDRPPLAPQIQGLRFERRAEARDFERNFWGHRLRSGISNRRVNFDLIPSRTSCGSPGKICRSRVVVMWFRPFRNTARQLFHDSNAKFRNRIVQRKHREWLSRWRRDERGLPQKREYQRARACYRVRRHHQTAKLFAEVTLADHIHGSRRSANAIKFHASSTSKDSRSYSA